MYNYNIKNNNSNNHIVKNTVFFVFTYCNC